MGAHETLRERKERASKALSSDEFLDIVMKKIAPDGSVYLGRTFGSQEAIILVLRGGNK